MGRIQCARLRWGDPTSRESAITSVVLAGAGSTSAVRPIGVAAGLGVVLSADSPSSLTTTTLPGGFTLMEAVAWTDKAFSGAHAPSQTTVLTNVIRVKRPRSY